jgi:hypothetical protein
MSTNVITIAAIVTQLLVIIIGTVDGLHVTGVWSPSAEPMKVIIT